LYYRLQMKKFPLNPRLVIFLTLLLFVLILGQSILEYRSSRKAVLDLMNNQAQALILSVAKASEKGLVAYEIQQDKITQHLFTVTEMVDRLDRIDRLDDQSLRDIADGNKLSELLLYDLHGSPERFYTRDSAAINPEEFKTGLLSEIFSGKASRLPLGFIGIGANRSFAVALSKSRGGAIVAGIDAGELLTLRKAFGTGSVIDDISQSPGVKYAGIFRSGSLVVASKSFENDSTDGWYRPDSLSAANIRTRIKSRGGKDEAFEAKAPFTVAGDPFGDIVIGIDTGYLNLLSTKLRQDIIWRSILFLIVSIAALAGVILQQNYRLLSGQYAEIQRDVQRLEADKALSAKLVAMGELAGGVAHEIRNPLNAIRVIIQRLEREFKPQSDEAEYTELTSVIRKETDKINESVKNFLTLAKPPVLHKTKGDLNNCIKETITLFQPRAQSKGCAVRTELSELPLIEFDNELMHQAILNLLENALAAMDSNGLITIKTYFQEGRCFVEISDNGAGISDDEKPRVFDLYYTTKPAGTGMGLPMVLRIIKEHGGRIDLVDSPSGGALFRMELASDK
jgi:signal transduction histidine kinase